MKNFIITAADVRKALDLKSTGLDATIEAGIASVGIDLEVRYRRSLRVGEAPAGSEAFFTSKVVQWANQQDDISNLIWAERRAGLDAALVEAAKPLEVSL